jgi:hypothetical protein
MRGQTNTGNAYSLVTFIGFDAAPSPVRAGAATGSAASAPATNAVFLGNDKYVVETPQGWVAPTGTAAASDDAAKNSRGGGSPGARSGGGARGTRGGGARGAGGMGGGSRGRSGAGGEVSASSNRTKLPASINLPHEELAIIAANYVELRSEKDAYVGKLTPAGTDLLLVPPGSPQHAPEGANGTFRLWVKDNVVTKYELTLSAASAPGRASSSGRFSETITVDVTGVGTTKFDVPATAKSKLRG